MLFDTIPTVEGVEKSKFLLRDPMSGCLDDLGERVMSKVALTTSVETADTLGLEHA